MKIDTIIFLLDSVSQPRCIKRIESFISSGFNVIIYGYDRNKYNLNAQVDNVKINVIGQKKDANQGVRSFIISQRNINKIINKHQADNVLFYSFGFLFTFSLFINGHRNYIYEISDILYANKKLKNIIFLFKWIDKLMIYRSKLTVVTSLGFLNFYFKQNKIKNNIIVQPNRVNSTFIRNKFIPVIPNLNNNKLVFSYVGAFRYPNTIFRFAHIIGKFFPNHEFHFYGDSYLTSEVKNLSNSYDNVKYFGPYKNPEDLPRIYSKIDVVVACYDTNGLNERIAEPNKLYEALYFRKPIIVSKNTFLEKRVNELQCGFSIDASNDTNIVELVNSLEYNKVLKIYNNILKVKSDEIVDDNSQSIINYVVQNSI